MRIFVTRSKYKKNQFAKYPDQKDFGSLVDPAETTEYEVKTRSVLLSGMSNFAFHRHK